ncbi:MAG: oligosaccharide flippase family protein, partial [Parachlamydiaceae bacterium]
MFSLQFPFSFCKKKQELENGRVSIDSKGDLNLNLSKKTFKASSWIFFGHALSQILRFLSNLILARLLVPEDFGLMQLVAVFLQGVSMFSDLGLSVNIIQHNKGDDPDFLRTAWTIQILRGVAIEFVLIAIAYPVSIIYEAPILLQLIPIAGLTAIISGFSSMNLNVANRNLQLSKITGLEIVAQFIGIFAMLLTAYYFRSVWALLVSGFVSEGLKTIYSHILFPIPKMKLEWMKEYAQEIYAFGKWIFISSMGGFLVSRLDRLILGLYLTISELGLYGIAIAMPMAIIEVVLSLGQKVMIPMYSHLWRNSVHKLRRETFKVRLALMALSMPPLFIMMIYGQEIVNFLYPSAYSGAGWMLQILAVLFAFKSITL